MKNRQTENKTTRRHRTGLKHQPWTRRELGIIRHASSKSDAVVTFAVVAPDRRKNSITACFDQIHRIKGTDYVPKNTVQMSDYLEKKLLAKRKAAWLDAVGGTPVATNGAPDTIEFDLNGTAEPVEAVALGSGGELFGPAFDSDDGPAKPPTDVPELDERCELKRISTEQVDGAPDTFRVDLKFFDSDTVTVLEAVQTFVAEFNAGDFANQHTETNDHVD